MVSKLLSISFFFFFFHFVLVCGASPQLSLYSAIRSALENNEELRAYRYLLETGKEDVTKAQSSLAPKLFFEERAMRTNNPAYALTMNLNQQRFSFEGAPASFNNPGILNDFQTSLIVEQTLFSRKSDIGIVMAKQEYAAHREDYRKKKQEIVLNVYTSYLSVGTASEQVKVCEKNLIDAQEHLRVAQSRYQAGLGLYADTLRAATAVTAAEQRLISAQKKLSVSKYQLGLLIGSSSTVDITGDLPASPAVRSIDYYNTAVGNRPDLASLELRSRAAASALQFAKAGYLPIVGLGGAYQMNDGTHLFGSSGESWQVAAFLRWNIFDGNRTSSEVKQAQLKQNELAERIKGAKKAALFKVYDAYLSVEEAAKNIELAKAGLASAEEGRRLVEMRYNASLSPITDLLDAQTNLDQARANLVAQENAYRQAVAVLDFESGIILNSFGLD